MEHLKSLDLFFILINIIYPLWLLATGSPIFWQRARPVATRPVVLQDDWFRVAGGIALFSTLLRLIFILTPVISVLRWILGVSALVAFLIGLWRSLKPRPL